MQPLELYVIIIDIILIVSVIIFPKIRLHSGQISGFLIENPGSPFVLAFIVLLLTAAVYFSYGMSNVSNELSEIAYFMILIGVVLQALSPYISKWLRTVFLKAFKPQKEKTRSMTKCPKCGYDNPMEAKYCLNCGFKLAQEEKYKLEAEGMLLIASGIILLLTLLFNALIKILPLLSLIYLVFGITSIYSGFRLYSGSSSIFNLILATMSIAFGFGGSFFLYLLGLSLKGLVSPDWIIYLIAAYKLYADRKRLKR